MHSFFVVFRWDNRWHCQSANDNSSFQSKFSLLHDNVQSKFQALVSLLWVKWLRTQRQSTVCKILVLREVIRVVFITCDNQRHFQSANDNKHFYWSWVCCMPSEQISSIGLFIMSEMRGNPTVKYEVWFCVTLLINCRHASVIVSVAPNLAVLPIMQVFLI